MDKIYSFTWTILTTAGKYFVTEIVLNGQKVAFNHTDGRGHDGSPMSTPHANIKLKNGDKVWIRTHGTNGQHAHGDPIAFQTSLTKSLQNMKNQETVIFDKVSLNEGNAYDKTSGIFTAPSDGIFSFSWTILTTTGKYFITEIVRNGQKVASNHADGRGHDGNPSSTAHPNIKMKKGDKVWIRTHSTSGQYAHGSGWNYFSGEKL
uniref:C1q domain-containing protein n=1 Tax=Magallana gigas TaxID=29159 RepID=A0A8W8LPR6_MAGGI